MYLASKCLLGCELTLTTLPIRSIPCQIHRTQYNATQLIKDLITYFLLRWPESWAAHQHQSTPLWWSFSVPLGSCQSWEHCTHVCCEVWRPFPLAHPHLLLWYLSGKMWSTTTSTHIFFTRWLHDRCGRYQSVEREMVSKNRQTFTWECTI